jgi:hypothetical protein
VCLKDLPKRLLPSNEKESWQKKRGNNSPQEKDKKDKKIKK